MQVSEMVQQIQYVLAPALMVSSSAMLLLGFQTKFSNLANRFRSLAHEKRALMRLPSRLPEEENRFNNLLAQLEVLLERSRLVKNAIFCAYAGILCFTATSILIFTNWIIPVGLWQIGLALFGIGFILVFCAAFLMIQEARLIYRIMKLEHRS